MKIATAFIVAAIAAFAADPVLAQSLVKPAPAGYNTPLLQQINANLTKLMDRVKSFGAQQKANPQATAIAQALVLEADYMRSVTGILIQHSQAASKVSTADKTKKTAADVLAPQKKVTNTALNNLQIKLDGMVKTIAQQDKARQPKDQAGPLADYQLELLQLRTQIDAVMLAELAD
jgi:hypothetical protein